MENTQFPGVVELAVKRMQERKGVVDFNLDPMLFKKIKESKVKAITANSIDHNLDPNTSSLGPNKVARDLFPEAVIVKNIHLDTDKAFRLIDIREQFGEIGIAIEEDFFVGPVVRHDFFSDFQYLN